MKNYRITFFAAALCAMALFATFQSAFAQQDCDCWVDSKTGKTFRDYPYKADTLADPNSAYRPGTSDYFHFDNNTCLWVNTTTGKGVGFGVPLGAEPDFGKDVISAHNPNTGATYYRITPCPITHTTKLQLIPLPSGEAAQGIKKIRTDVPGALIREIFTHQSIIESIRWGSIIGYLNVWITVRELYHTRRGHEIIDTDVDDDETDVVRLNDGSVINPFTGETIAKGIIDEFGELPKKIVGDALYALTAQNIFVSRDTEKTWTIDTAGLGGQPRDIIVDSEQYVYAVTYKNGNNSLSRQAPDSNIWRPMKIPPLVIWNKIYVDRLNRFYLGGAFSGKPVIYQSLDRGTTWTVDTIGLGKGSMFKFGDDAYGNVYAITSFSSSSAGDQMYRSDGTKWTRIDQPITGGNTDSLNNPAIFTAVGGDSVLVATSIYGVFSSSDKGTTWTESNDGISAEQFYGLRQTPSKRLLTTTNLGVFGINPADTAWKKTYPQNGYLGGQPLFNDNSGAIYTLGPMIAKPDFLGNPYPPRMTMKSTDGGTTWQSDTLGLAALAKVRTFLFYVDETGTQHLASYNGTSNPAGIYVKLPVGRWAGDTTGFTAPNGLPQAFGSDGLGTVWMSIGSTPSLWRRAVTGGAWSADTTGLGVETLNSFAAAKNGDLYAGGFAAVWKRTASKWSYIQPPSGIYPGATAYSVSIDSTGALIAGYQHFDANYNSIGDGVFGTTNDGKTWTNLQYVDTTTFKQFISYGDTTYGISYRDGIFVFTTGASGVSEKLFPASLNTLTVFPNPAASELRISYSIPKHSDVVLRIFDITGKEIATIANEAHDAGSYEKSWNVQSLPNGSYILKLTACSESVMKVVEIVR